MPHQRNLLLLPLLFIVASLQAQIHSISGKITNNKLEPLALVTIQVKGIQVATLSKEDGSYQLDLESGSYDIVYSMVGFKSQLITVVVNKNYTQNIILEAAETNNLSEVVVRGKLKDRSEEIIRNVIRNKENILAASGPYSCQVYIKATQQDSAGVFNKNPKLLKDSAYLRNKDLLHMAMAEISLRYDHETDEKIKEERTGVSKRGNAESLFFLSLTEGNFNLYNNLLKAPGLAPVPFLSPVSYSGLSAYKYKIIHTATQGGHKLYTISMKPKQLSNVTVEGELTIQDSSWVILSARFVLPGYHIPEYDLFEISQQYSYVNDQAWMITRQQFRYASRYGKGKLSGETIADYQDFSLQKQFPKNHFGLEVSATSQQAYERDSSFWEKTRTEPLTAKEIRFIQYKDSIYRVVNSKAYLDSVDRITNKTNWKKIVYMGQTLINRKEERTWILPPIIAVYQPFQFGGARIGGYAFFNKGFKSKKTVNIYTALNYGLRNHDVNGNIRLNRMYNPFNRAFFRIELMRGFKYIYEGDAWINLVRRNNFYLDNSIGLGHGQELANGLFLYTDIDFALRRSLSSYKVNHQVDTLFGNYLDNNQAVAFNPYNALYGKIKLQFTPFQRYIREPREKVILGSKWPTFYALYRQGIPGFLNSKVDFSYLEYGIEQTLKLGTAGVSRYTIRSGSFLSKKDLRLVDYQFQRRGDPIFFSNPSEAFQSLDSSFPTFKRFYQGHYLHEFNGAILNKVPLLKKLRLHEIAGGGFLLVPERDLRYGELFAGIEKVFKWPFSALDKFKVGVYIVGSAANQFRNPVQFKIGITSWDRKNNKWQ